MKKGEAGKSFNSSQKLAKKISSKDWRKKGNRLGETKKSC